MRTLKGPAIFLAQFAGDKAPFDNFDNICKWAAGLGYKGVQIPTWVASFIDLDKAATSKAYCDDLILKIALFDDGFSGEPLVDEERQGRHIERQPFRLTGPGEEGFAQALELGCSGLRVFEALGVEDLPNEPLSLLTSWILGIPIQCGRER